MPTLRINFWTKTVLALLLVEVADLVIYGRWSGAASSFLGVAVVGAVAAAHPALFRSRLGACAIALAFAYSLLPIERPSLLGWLFVWTALGVASLVPRAGRDDVLGWARRLAVAGLKGITRPLRDLRLVRRSRLRVRGGDLVTPLRIVSLFGLPMAGGVVFTSLFAAANPVIASTLARLRLPMPDVARLMLWVALALAFWRLLRPRGPPKALARPKVRPARKDRLPVPVASVVLSLVVFNGLFAVQNGLDLVYLWSGVSLPDGATFAEYAHRGAYLLILTALLAGAFVLVFLAPGSEVARLRSARLLVTAWVAQNVFLVASTALRTLDYIGAYSLTRLRIAALAWMALVALGLGLIGWRLLRDKSSSWLLNTNAAAAGMVLAVCAIVDLGGVAAAWNVRHARELGTGGAELDLCYLQRIGPAALGPLSELERRPLPPALLTQVAGVRDGIMLDLIIEQQNWRSWTWRGARQLDHAEALAGRPVARRDLCDVRAPPLTPAQQTGS